MTKHALAQRIEASLAASISELKKNPSAIVDSAEGAAVAILNHNSVVAYLVPAATYETMVDRLEDAEFNAIADARAEDEQFEVTLDDLQSDL